MSKYILRFDLLIVFIIFILIKCVSAEYNRSLCCPPGQYFLSEHNVCWKKGNDSTRIFTNSTLMTCKKYNVRSYDFYVNEAGQLIIIRHDGFLYPKIKPDRFCVNPTYHGTRFNASAKAETAAVLCIDQKPKIVEDEVYGYCTIISVICLAITALIYYSLPELRDLQGVSIAAFCTSYCIALMITVIIKVMPYRDMNLCAARGFLSYFFLMASSFWLNAIVIQTINGTRNMNAYKFNGKKFGWYSLYACGIPTILTMCMAIVNFTPGNHDKPGIGLFKCWFIDMAQTFYYLYIVNIFLIIINIGIFMYNWTKIWRSSSYELKNEKAVKYKFMMTLWLFILFSLVWVVNMIATTIEEDFMVVVILNVLCCFIGIYIFLLLVVFRRRTVKAMYKHGWLNCLCTAGKNRLAAYDDDEDVVENKEVHKSLYDHE